MISHMYLPYGAAKQDPSRIIIHAMAEFIDDGVVTRYAHTYLKQYRLSAHSLITPSGVNIRTRRDNQGAHHAKAFNTDSLGIEFLVPGVHNYQTFLEEIKTNYLTEAAYQTGLNQIMEWIDMHNIKHIDGHSDIDPERKYDPGTGFPMGRLLDDLQLDNLKE